MKRRAFFLTSFLTPLVAYFKPAPKPSVAEIADAARSYKTWYTFEQKYSDGINQWDASFEQKYSNVIIWSLPEGPNIWNRNKY